MKITEPTSSSLTALLKRDADLALKSEQSSKTVHALRAQKRDGKKNVDDKEARIQKILAGEDVPPANNIDAQIASAMLRWEAINDAREALRPMIAIETRKAAVAQSAELKPEHDQKMVKLCSTLVDAHAAYNDLFSMKHELIGKGVGLIGLCLLMPDFFGSPQSHNSPLAFFLAEAKRAGYIGEVPKALRP
jgi:hypothetical protein